MAWLFSESFTFIPGDGEIIAVGENGEQLLQQVEVSPYRLDFALLDPDGMVRLCVETDGHQFHERTPEQAEHDRARDRRLLAAGWSTIRFTGREVLRNPVACAKESLEVFAQLRAQRGPGLVKTSAPRIDEPAPRTLSDEEAEWQAELLAAKLASDEVRHRHGMR